MRIYVAGKTGDIPTVRRVQKLAESFGYTITHDWTKVVESVGGAANEMGVPPHKQREYAQADLEGVYRASLIIACGHPDLCGTLWECGAGVAWGCLVWLYRWEYVSRHSVFEHLPNVTVIEDDGLQLAKMLWKYSEKRIELGLPEHPLPGTINA